ncbi:MAG: hypothetical protein AB1941_11270 [Gemmatimonadota bacterium]
MEITAVEPFLAYFESVRARTERVVACIPRSGWSGRTARAPSPWATR